MQSVRYDAIVVGSGISGGWAAKELTEKGLRVLLLERGRNVEHIKDYVNATKAPWEYLHRGGHTHAIRSMRRMWRSGSTRGNRPTRR
jgi:choline dehydrogenase-like flavoprotein